MSIFFSFYKIAKENPRCAIWVFRDFLSYRNLGPHFECGYVPNDWDGESIIPIVYPRDMPDFEKHYPELEGTMEPNK